MLEYLAHLLNWFHFNHQSNMDNYIASKNPQNAGDVEHWMRDYEKRTKFYSF